MKNHQKVKIKQYDKLMEDGSVRHYTIAYIALDDLEKEFKGYFWGLMEMHYREPKRVPQTLCGVTYAHGGDEYNAELGMEIARAKLYKKIFKLKKHLIARVLHRYIEEELKTNDDLVYANKQYNDADEIFELAIRGDCSKNTLDMIKGIKALRSKIKD